MAVSAENNIKFGDLVLMMDELSPGGHGLWRLLKILRRVAMD